MFLFLVFFGNYDSRIPNSRINTTLTFQGVRCGVVVSIYHILVFDIALDNELYIMFCGFRKSFRQSEMDLGMAYTEENWNRLER